MRQVTFSTAVVVMIGLLGGTAPAQEAPASLSCKAIHADLVEAQSTTSCKPGHPVCFLGEVDGNHGLRGTTYFRGEQGALFPPAAPTFRSYVGTFELLRAAAVWRAASSRSHPHPAWRRTASPQKMFTRGRCLPRSAWSRRRPRSCWWRRRQAGARRERQRAVTARHTPAGDSSSYWAAGESFRISPVPGLLEDLRAFGREQCPSDVETIADLEKMPGLLRKRGYTEDDVANIVHGNFIRFLRGVWG